MSVVIHTIDGKTLEGTVYAVDPVTNFIILERPESSYVVINPTQISSIDGTLNLRALPDIASLGIGSHNIEKYEQKMLEQAEKSLSALNSSVSADVQSLFDRMNSLFPCHWQGVSMVVLNEYVIHPPYDQVVSNQPQPSSDKSGLNRVIRMFEGEKKKMQKEAEAASSR